MWLFAQDLPDPALLQGNVQEILVWVVLSQIVLWVATVAFFLSNQKAKDVKYDEMQDLVIKIVHRSNRAMEAVANISPPEDPNV